jgi:very-short-patch-repair endonuclease
MRHKRAAEPVDMRIAALAGRQGGVVGARQLLDLGLDRSAIARRVRRGWLHPIHRGVYAVGHPTLGATGRWHAAVLVCGDRAVLSHRSAAAAWELRPVPGGAVDVTVPPDGSRRRDGVRTHRTSLAEHETTVLEGLRITTPERTLLDLAAVSRRDVLERAVEQAEWRRLADRAELGRLAATSQRGAPALRAVLAEPMTVTRSILERRMLALCRKHGLPRPQVNVRVGDYEVDFLWARQRLVVETDGGEFHRTRQAFENDRRRDADLTVAGFRVVRFTHHRIVHEPDWVAERLRRLLAAG